MEFLAYIILAFSLIQLLVLMVNLWFPERMDREISGSDHLISILIPARNEEATIGNCIKSILCQEHGRFELLIGDDQSSDNTAEIVEKFGKRDDRIKLVRLKSLPEDWLGKNYACAELPKEAKGDYLLFLDADVQISKNIIFECLHHMKRYNLQLLSLFPHQVLKTKGEKQSVPIVYYILLSLLPLRLVRGLPFPSLAAANGQFIMFESKTYKNEHPHKKLRKNCTEDIGIARLYKTRGHRISCMIADERVKCRMYDGFRSSVIGFSKNVTAYFGNSTLIASLFWLTITLGFFPVYLGTGIIGLGVYIVMYLLSRTIVSIISKQNIPEQLKYSIHQQMALGLIIYHHVKNKITGICEWKGRNVLRQDQKKWGGKVEMMKSWKVKG